MSQATTDATQIPAPTTLPDVLTLAEAAVYLRVPESELMDLAARRELPGRKIGDQWRFHKRGLAIWLCATEKRDFWETQLGALKDDPYMEEMLEHVYRDRGRPMIEED